MTGNIDTGAATLEQQLAKNLYFPKNNGLFSKVAEAELALKLDAHYSKNDILRMYLAEVYLATVFYGLPAARGYFGVMPVQLSWAQASMLAGLVQAPSAYDPIDHMSTVRLRQRHVQNRLVATKVLSPAQADTAFAAPLGLR
jgi:membrane peptidoglycan carboxypeptidase